MALGGGSGILLGLYFIHLWGLGSAGSWLRASPDTRKVVQVAALAAGPFAQIDSELSEAKTDISINGGPQYPKKC